MARILHINDYNAETGGGAEVVMRQTIALLRTQGHAVETFTADDLADPRRTPWRYLNNFSARKALSAKLDSFRPRVVHLHNFYHLLSPGILAELNRYKQKHDLRVVMTAHDYHLVCPNSGGNWFRLFSGRRGIFDRERIGSVGYLFSRSWDQRSVFYSWLRILQHLWSYRWKHLHQVIDLVICPSRFTQQLMAKTGLKNCCLPHPATLLPKADTTREGRLQMVFAGRLEPEKGLNEFLQLLPADLDADLTVIGTGPELQRCQETCARRGLTDRVRFLGRLPHEQTVAQIAKCHLLVMPSRVLESYGLVLIEALASGTNILAADRGAAAEIVESTGVGFLYKLDDSLSLQNQLHVIQQKQADGTLNRFDLTAVLDQRSEARYLERLLGVYGGLSA